MFDLIVGTANFVASSVDNEKGTPNLSTPGQSSLVFLLITYKVHSFVNLTRFSPSLIFKRRKKIQSDLQMCPVFIKLIKALLSLYAWVNFVHLCFHLNINLVWRQVKQYDTGTPIKKAFQKFTFIVLIRYLWCFFLCLRKTFLLEIYRDLIC